MNVEVIAVSSHHPTQEYYIFKEFLTSLRRFGIEVKLLGTDRPWRGLMTKPRVLREYLRNAASLDEPLIVCDAWEVVFAGHPNEAWELHAAACQSEFGGDGVTFNAERSCFPLGHLSDDPAFPERPTPWRYLNSGFMVGRGRDILTIMDDMNIDAIPDDTPNPDGSWFRPNDDAEYTLAFVRQPVPMRLDWTAEICWCHDGTELGDIDTTDARPKNLISGTVPIAHHFNGDAKNTVQPFILKHMGLI